MPFSVHMDDRTRHAIEVLARKSGKTRNALINDAVREFVRSRSRTTWPDDVRAWLEAGPRRAGAAIPPFESFRKDLAKQRETDL